MKVRNVEWVVKISKWLKSGFFVNIGVSVDLFGDQRVNVVDRSSEKTVLQNMRRLIDAGISFGCIHCTVESNRAAHPRHLPLLEDFDTSFRLLPVYRTIQDYITKVVWKTRWCRIRPLLQQSLPRQHLFGILVKQRYSVRVSFDAQPVRDQMGGTGPSHLWLGKLVSAELSPPE